MDGVNSVVSRSPRLLILLSLWASWAPAEVENKIYWTAERGIARSDMDASNKEWIIEADVRRPGSIAIDEVNEKIYWTHHDWNKPVTIHRSDLDGSDLEVISRAHGEGHQAAPLDVHIDIDSQDRKIYITVTWSHGDYTSGSVSGFDLDVWDGSEERALDLYDLWLWRHAETPYEAAVDPVNRKLYFIDRDFLTSFDIDSFITDNGVLLEVTGNPGKRVYPVTAMAGYGDAMTWQDIHDLEIDPKSGVTYWSAPGGIGKGRPEEGREGVSLLMEVPARQIAVDSEEEDLYWAKGGEIFRAALEGSSSDLVIDASGFRDRPGMSNIVDMAVFKGRIYWSDRAGTLQSCNRDGKDLQTLFAPVVRRPAGIFVDSDRGKILWGDRLAGSVFEAGLDGSDIQVLASDFVEVSDVLATEDRVYWSDNERGEIWFSELDGSGAEAAIQLGRPPIEGGFERPPMSISYDSASHRLCWSRRGDIFCADHEGSNVDSLHDGDESSLYYILDIAVDGQQGFIYWTAEGGLWRMDLDGREKEHFSARDIYWTDPSPIALSTDGVFWITWFSWLHGDGTWAYLQHSNKDGTDARWIPEGGESFEVQLFGDEISDLPESLALYLPVKTAVHHSSRPLDTALHPNYPNPFNASTEIPYTLSRSGLASLVIYNALGQRIETLVNEVQRAGSYTVSWRLGSARPLSSGVYFCRLVTPGEVLTRKLTLLR